MDIIDQYGNILFLNTIMAKNFGKDALGKKHWEASVGLQGSHEI